MRNRPKSNIAVGMRPTIANTYIVNSPAKYQLISNFMIFFCSDHTLIIRTIFK